MYDLYARLKKLSELYGEDLAFTDDVLIDAALDYQQTNNPQAFAFVFCRVYKVTLSVVKHWYSLSEHEKQSSCLEVLHKALMTYGENQKQTVQYWYCYLLKKDLYTKVEALNYKKRKANNRAKSFEEESEKFDGVCDDRFSVVETLDNLKNLNLTDREYIFCKEIVQNTGRPLKDVDIANILGVSNSAINQMKKRLKFKLQPLFT